MTRMQIGRVRLHNIDDAAAFVIDALRRSGIPAHTDEREDLIADGLAMLCYWADRWDPDSYGDGTGSFAGYAHTFLPQRLKDAWHRSHPEHVYATGTDGRRRYEYGERPLSLDLPTYTPGVEEPHTIADVLVGSTMHPDPHETTIPDRFLHALPALPAEHQEHAHQVVEHLHHGYSIRETAQLIGVSVTRVTRIRGAISTALAHPTIAA